MYLIKWILPIATLSFIPIILSRPDSSRGWQWIEIQNKEDIINRNTNYLTEGRGIGSTLWGWLSYPFSWWSADPEHPANDQIVPPIIAPYENIVVGRRNVTVWCNEQTCTTERCDKFGCTNLTCNIYDTDMTGECRQYNTVSEDPVTPKPTAEVKETTESTIASTEAITKTSDVTAAAASAKEDNDAVEERPIELEAVMSSSVIDEDIKPKDQLA